jgi:hypothetical protein
MHNLTSMHPLRFHVWYLRGGEVDGPQCDQWWTLISAVLDLKFLLPEIGKLVTK